MEFEDRFILAMDTTDGKKISKIYNALRYHRLTTVKIGLELFCYDGIAQIRHFEQLGGKVFLDLKIEDIPNTVSRAIRSIHQYANVSMTTIMGDSNTVAAALAAGTCEMQEQTKIVYVPLLSSTEDYSEYKVFCDISLAQSMGVYGVVLTGKGIIRLVRDAFSRKELKIITPGIRLDTDHYDDHDRVMMPLEAFTAGSDFLVLGRTVTEHEDMVERLTQVLDQCRDFDFGDD